MSNDPPKLSFGFSKTKAAPKLLKKSAIPSKIESPAQKVDFVSSYEDQLAQSIKKDEDTSLVIPITHSRVGIRAQMLKKYTAVEPKDQLTADAVKALTSGTAMEVDDFAQSSNLVVPMKVNVKYDGQTNQVVEEKEDEENIEDADYDAIPIESFGMALLKGMGFTEEHKGPSFEDYMAKVRLKGLGLGADPDVLKKARQVAKQSVVNGDEKLSWKVGARCQALMGRQEGQYGVVQGFDGDTGRVIVRLTASKVICKIMQSLLRLVPETEFNKYANYINKSSADKYKADEANENNKISKPSTNGRESMHVTRTSSSPRFRSRSPLISSHSSSSLSWARRGLLVRYMNKSGPKKQFYKERVKIIDSNSSGSRFTCETDSHDRINDVRVADLQKIVPKHRGDPLQIVNGRYDGQLASLVKRDSKASRVYVELQQDSENKIIKVDFDDVCSIKR